jgi:hypothetical protein
MFEARGSAKARTLRQENECKNAKITKNTKEMEKTT